MNNAGFGTVGTFHELPISKEISEIGLNVVAVARLTHAALPGMVARGRGGVINVASIAGVPADAAQRDLRRDQGVREQPQPGGARGAARAPA